MRSGKFKLFSVSEGREQPWECTLQHQLTVATVFGCRTVLLYLCFYLLSGGGGRRPGFYVNSPDFLNWQLIQWKKKIGWIIWNTSVGQIWSSDIRLHPELDLKAAASILDKLVTHGPSPFLSGKEMELFSCGKSHISSEVIALAMAQRFTSGNQKSLPVLVPVFG